MLKKTINCLYNNMLIVKNKLYSPFLLGRIFNKSNATKVIIIFFIGFISRIIINYTYDVNVYLDYLNKISLLYYAIMSLLVVFINELIIYFELNIIPTSGFAYIGLRINFFINFVFELGKTFINFNFKIIPICLNIRDLLRGFYLNDYTNKIPMGHSDLNSHSNINNKAYKEIKPNDDIINNISNRNKDSKINNTNNCDNNSNRNRSSNRNRRIPRRHN
jgi:hypothetical protein